MAFLFVQINNSEEISNTWPVVIVYIHTHTHTHTHMHIYIFNSY